MVDLLRIGFSLVLLAIDIGLIYFAVRLLQVFRGGKMEKPWFYFISGLLAVAVSSCLFVFYDAFELPPIVYPVGGIIVIAGVALILIGLRIQYLSWTRGN